MNQADEQSAEILALPANLSETLVASALHAGKAIQAHYQSGPIHVASKADDSPVTQADIDAEAIILADLAQAFPDIPVVSEEAAAEGKMPKASARFFLVDPLDGTKEFISRNGEFTVNIALIDHGVPVAGVVLAPAQNKIYYGDHETGARQAVLGPDGIGPWASLCVRAADDDKVTAVGSRSHGGAQTDAYMRNVGATKTFQAGSSLKFCLVACGQADIYPRFSPTMEWDTAAGDAVLRAAGGMVFLPDGSALTYGKRARRDAGDFANPNFVAVGCSSIKDRFPKLK